MEETQTPEEIAAMAKRVRNVAIVVIGLAMLVIFAAANSSKVDQVNSLPMAPDYLQPGASGIPPNTKYPIPVATPKE